MTTWFLKECPKCGGDLYLNSLISSRMGKCLQCSLEVKLSCIADRRKVDGQPAARSPVKTRHEKGQNKRGN